jgi:hypothetical protein
VSEQSKLPLGLNEVQEERDDSEHVVDEHGSTDEWDRGGVYGFLGGELLLGPTKDLLAERFEPVARELPDQVGRFERVDVSDRYDGISARYETSEKFKTVVRIFPRGPYLRAWTVSILKYKLTPRKAPRSEQWRGSSSRTLEGAVELDEPRDAVDAALEYMEGSA